MCVWAWLCVLSVLLGSPGCFVSQLADACSAEFITTIGIDYKLKSMNLLGKKVKLQVRQRVMC